MPIDMKLVIAGQFKELVRRGNVDKITVKDSLFRAKCRSRISPKDK